MNALLRTVDEISAGRPIALVAGFLADKDAASCLAPWRGRAARVFLALVDSHRAMSSDDMRAAALRAGIVDAAPPLPLRDAWQNAREWCRRNGALLIIAGSLYLAGEVLRLVEEGFLARE
jgi:dihydrofolate synthase/folylpolyglutamate synthase